jgi:hypothetical protein
VEWCPAGTRVLSAEQLPAQRWFPVTPIPLGGRGRAPIAYQIQWANQSVLFTGRIPILRTQATARDLFQEFGRSRERVDDYLGSLDRLSKLKPDLWLPATPTDGQNVNLYDSEWEDILASNREMFR